MRTIHKYVLTSGVEEVHTFEGARFLAAANQGEEITVWAEVQTLGRECMRRLHVVPTGEPVPTEPVDFVGTVLLADGALVFHVYAEIQR